MQGSGRVSAPSKLETRREIEHDTILTNAARNLSQVRTLSNKSELYMLTCVSASSCFQVVFR